MISYMPTKCIRKPRRDAVELEEVQIENHKTGLELAGPLQIHNRLNTATAEHEDEKALYLASEQGREDEVQKLLLRCVDANAQGGFYNSALQAASQRGHKQVVQALVDGGADINANGGFYNCALQASSAGGHKDFVQLLLDKGAKINSQGGAFGCALLAAAYLVTRGLFNYCLRQGQMEVRFILRHKPGILMQFKPLSVAELT